MRIINPLWSAARQSTDPFKAKAKVQRYLKRLRDSKEWLSVEREFELFNGEASTGRREKMEGWDAHRMNKQWKQDYFLAVQSAFPSDYEGRMQQWRPVAQ